MGKQDEGRDAKGYAAGHCGIFQKAFQSAAAGMIQERNSKQDEKIPEYRREQPADCFVSACLSLLSGSDTDCVDPAGKQFGDSIKRQQGGKIQDGAECSMQSFSTHPPSKAYPLCIIRRKINRKYDSYAVYKNGVEIGTRKT